LNAVYNSITLYVNGLKVVPKDSDGNVVEPFIVDGTTYLPVRAVSQALNLPVDYDSKTSTVYLGQKPSGGVIGLSSIPYARATDSNVLAIDGWGSSKDPFIIASKSYANGIGMYSMYNEKYVVYNTNSQYKTLTGTFGLDDKNKGNGDTTEALVIYGDDKEIYRSGQTHPGDTVNVKVDITGVNQLKVLFTLPSGSSSIYPVLANPQLVN
jgi:hypothetical protein